jgi:hypothetical protein
VRRVITGVDAEGRSTVLADGPELVAFHATTMADMTKVAGADAPYPVAEAQAVVHELWSIGAQPKVGADDPTAAIVDETWVVPAGETKWILTHMGPNLFTPMHATATIDYGLVVAGSVVMGLEDGTEVELTASDAVLVDGVQHSWKAGPVGCTIATVLVGLAP